MKRLVCVITLIALVSMTGCDRKDQKTAAKIGSSPSEQGIAPEVLVTALDGAPLKLSDLKGKVVLLNFWATWCPPCREEIPSMMKLNSAMAGKPFQMVAVSIDEGGKPAIEAFFKTHNYTLPAYIDPENRASKTYGITGVPETFIIDKKGVIVKIIGPLAWDSPDVAAFLDGLLK